MEVKNIAIFGRRNSGKSSLMNLLCGQQISIVAPVAGTTTDPVRKRVELEGVGPCNFIDTAGFDDEGELGAMRVSKSQKIVSEIDMAILLFTGNLFSDYEKRLMKLFKRYSLPVLLIHNQEDIISLGNELKSVIKAEYGIEAIPFSCSIIDADLLQSRVDALLGLISNKLQDCIKEENNHRDGILASLIKENERVLFVCPIDSEAPAGRLILPQVMGLRDALDNFGIATVAQPSQLPSIFPKAAEMQHATVSQTSTTAAERLNPLGFNLVITDSQAFGEVAEYMPANLPLGSFSILLARQKGAFSDYMEGVKEIDNLKDGDKVLILESCSHKPTCEDIGRVKIPKMLSAYTKKRLEFVFISGLDEIPKSNYALAIQCGGCVATHKQLINRLTGLIERGLSVTNYGIAIAYIKGLFKNRNFQLFLEKLPPVKK